MRVGGTLSLTGFLAQTAVIHKIASEIMVEEINSRDGFLGRPVEFILLDDQSKPDVARSLYEKLITVDKVDLIQGPYATAPILAAMGVAQRYGKVMIQSSMGIPKLQTYDMAFPATPFGPEPDKSYPNVLPRCDGDALAARPRAMVVLTSKFPSAQFMAQGMKDRGREARREGAALSRIRSRQPRLRRHRRPREGSQRRLPVGRLAGAARATRSSKRCASSTTRPRTASTSIRRRVRWRCRPTATSSGARPSSNRDEPFMSRPGVKKIAEALQGARDQGEPAVSASSTRRPPGMVSEWQILEQGVNGAKSLEDKAIAAWLKKNVVNTIYGPTKFDGLYNHGAPAQLDPPGAEQGMEGRSGRRSSPRRRAGWKLIGLVQTDAIADA